MKNKNKPKNSFVISKIRNKRNQEIYDKIKRAREGSQEYVTVKVFGENRKVRCLIATGKVTDIEECGICGFLMKGNQEILFCKSYGIIKNEKIHHYNGKPIGAATFFKKALCGIVKCWEA